MLCHMPSDPISFQDTWFTPNSQHLHLFVRVLTAGCWNLLWSLAWRVGQCLGGYFPEPSQAAPEQ